MFAHSYNYIAARAKYFFAAILTLVVLSSILFGLVYTSAAAVAAPAGASTRMKVIVPESMQTAPFDVDRFLNVPPNFSAAVYTRIPKARFMAIAPNGDLLVSQPATGKVLLVQPHQDGDPIISDFVADLRRPHDIVFHTIDGTTYVYIAETHQINRYTYTNGDTTGQNREILITGLPDSSTPELRGAYGHELKNIALDGNNKLYVSIASTCNACIEDTISDPIRSAIYQYDADGSNQRLFAQGLRNATGLDFIPGTNELWVTVNNRDNIGYPFNDDWDGDGSNDYGKIIPSYVDNHPPDEFTKVRDGGNYGWPFCNPNPNSASGYNDMPYDLDVQINPDGDVDCNAMDRINQGIQAHSAPLGLTFLQDTNFPEPYRQGAAIGYRGSWNRTVKTGYKVAYFPWDSATQTPGDQIDLITGWLNDETQEVWGRPVDVAVDSEGNMFVSDDTSGTIYKVTYTPPTGPTPTPSVFLPLISHITLINADTNMPISEFDPLEDGTTIDLSTLPTNNLSIRANPDPAEVGSVRFTYDGDTNYQLENHVPYAIAGDSQGGANYTSWTPTVGSHTLVVTPYTEAQAQGAVGMALTVSFEVTE